MGLPGIQASHLSQVRCSKGPAESKTTNFVSHLLNTSLHGPYIPYISMLTWKTFHQPEGMAPAPGASSSSWGSTFLLVRPAVSNADAVCDLKKLHKTYYMLTYWILWIPKSILAPCTHVIPKILVDGCSFSSTSNCLFQAWECWAAVSCSLAFCTWHFTQDEWKCWHSATLQAKPESILPIQTQPSSICTFPRPVQLQRNHVWSFGKICSM